MKDFFIHHFDKMIVLGILLAFLHSAIAGNTWSQGEVHGLTEALLTMTLGAGLRAAAGRKDDDPEPPKANPNA